MPDDQDVRSKGAQHSELTFENRAGADPERALIASAEPPRPPSGKDCCSPHQFAVGSRTWAVGAWHPRATPADRRLPTAVTLSENATHD
jgi:hypothetical protein